MQTHKPLKKEAQIKPPPMGFAKQLTLSLTWHLLHGWFHSKPQICLTQDPGGASADRLPRPSALHSVPKGLRF